ncbi:MAG: MFS transporter [Oscillospiraceae bacterium]|nr:MFS transporter [Oscillospiraceae bacterium]
MTQKDLNGRRRTLGLIFCCVLMFSFSFSSALFYTLQPLVLKHFDLTLTQSSWISISGSIGNMAINMLLMATGDRFDKSRLLRWLTFVLAGSLLLLGVAPGFALFIIAYAINGIVGYWLDMLTTSYVSDLYGEQRSRYIGILYTLFTVGSAVAPSFNTLVLETLQLSWQYSYILSGIYTVLVAVAFAVLIAVVGKPQTATEAVAAEKGEEVNTRLPVKEALANRNMIAFILASLTIAFSGYFSSALPLYFDYEGGEVFTTALVNLIVTCSSVGSMISRFAYVPLADKINPIKYLRFQSLFCAACNLICLLVGKPSVWMALMFISGLLQGSSHTLTVVLTCDEYPDRSAAATATTALFTGFAYMAVTPIMNFVAEKTSFFLAMIIPIGFSVLTWVVYRFVYVEHKKAA